MTYMKSERYKGVNIKFEKGLGYVRAYTKDLSKEDVKIGGGKTKQRALREAKRYINEEYRKMRKLSL